MAETYVDLLFILRRQEGFFVTNKLSMSGGLRVIVPCSGYLTVLLNDLGVFCCKYGLILLILTDIEEVDLWA